MIDPRAFSKRRASYKQLKLMLTRDDLELFKAQTYINKKALRETLKAIFEDEVRREVYGKKDD